MQEIIELEKRREIYALIKKYPGLNLSKIAEMLKMRVSLVEYHLNYLERYDLVTSVKDDWFKHYYVKEDMGVKDRKILAALRKEKFLKIVLVLLKHPNLTHGDILKHIDIKRSTLSYYLEKLVKKGIVVKSSEEGKQRRYVVFDEKEVIRIITRYKPYRAVDGTYELWKDFKR